MKNRIITDINKIKTRVVYKADYFNEWKKDNSAIILSFFYPNTLMKEERFFLLSNNHITVSQEDASEFGYNNKYSYGFRPSLNNYIKAGQIIVYDNIIDIKQIEIV